MALVSLFPTLYLVLGVLMAFGRLAPEDDGSRIVGWVMASCGSFFMIAGLCFAAHDRAGGQVARPAPPLHLLPGGRGDTVSVRAVRNVARRVHHHRPGAVVGACAFPRPSAVSRSPLISPGCSVAPAAVKAALTFDFRQVSLDSGKDLWRVNLRSTAPSAARTTPPSRSSSAALASTSATLVSRCATASSRANRRRLSPVGTRSPTPTCCARCARIGGGRRRPRGAPGARRHPAPARRELGEDRGRDGRFTPGGVGAVLVIAVAGV